MHILEDLNDLLEEQIGKIVKKGDITPTELDNVYKAMKTMYYAETTNAMKEYGQSNGYSGRGTYATAYGRGSYDGGYDGSYGGSYDGSMDGGSSRGRRGRDGDGDGRYSEEGGSYRRGRDSMGRFTSRADEKEMMISKLEKMMQNASNEQERQTIMQCIRKIESNN